MKKLESVLVIMILILPGLFAVQGAKANSVNQSNWNTASLVSASAESIAPPKYTVGLLVDYSHSYTDIVNLLKGSKYVSSISLINIEDKIKNNEPLNTSGLDILILNWDTGDPNTKKLGWLEKYKANIDSWVYSGGVFVCQDQTGSFIPFNATYKSLFSSDLIVKRSPPNEAIKINNMYINLIGVLPNNLSPSDLIGTVSWKYWDHYTYEISRGYFTSWASDWKPLLYNSDNTYPILLMKDYGKGFYFPSTMFFEGSGLQKILENIMYNAPVNSVIFNEQGLPSGTSWSITLDGNTITSTINQITFLTGLNGQYSYTVNQPDGYWTPTQIGAVLLSGGATTYYADKGFSTYGVVGTGNFTISFGPAVATKWNPKKDFYSFLNNGLFNDGGDCYGFASTSILYFRHYKLEDPSYPFFPLQASTLSDLNGTDIGVNFSQSTFPIYIHQTFDINNLVPKTQADSVSKIINSISSGMPIVLMLGPTEGHSVVAWGYAQLPDGTLMIGISDPTYGNQAGYAYYSNDQFSYSWPGLQTWTMFSVVSPTMMQWSWLSQQGIFSFIKEVFNPYYNYVFSTVPITIVGSSGEALFTQPGKSSSFVTNIDKVVGFEEGSIQVYGIPKEIQYTIQDPGETYSQIVVIIPRNQTSITGYQVSTVSNQPLNMTISPTDSGFKETTLKDIRSSVAFFSISQSGHSLLNATSIPLGSSQTAMFSVANWDMLNSTQSPVSLQVFQPNSETPAATYVLTNGQQGLPTNTNPIQNLILPFAAIAIVGVIGIISISFYLKKVRA